MSIILLAGLGGVVLLLALAAVAMPGKPSAAVAGIAHLAEPLRPAAYDRDERSLRDRELDEDSAAIASEFRRARRERYLASLRADASEYFLSSTTSAKKSAS